MLTGNDGANVLTGGLGNDIYYAGAGDSVVEDSATGGTDIVYASASFTLGANVENLTLTGSADINATGNALANVITGNAGANVLDGGAGLDIMTGGLGNDTYVVDSLSDKVIETGAAGSGVDTIETSITYSLNSKALAFIENLTLTGAGDINGTGNALANVLTGNDHNNVLDGGAGLDTLSGGGGDDRLIGGLGNDSLTGGAGADDFIFNLAANASNLDTITDFETGIDHISLENAIFKAIGLTTGVLGAAQFVAGAGAVATTTDQHIIYDQTTGALYYDADGSDAGAMIQIAALAPALTLLNTDFMVV